MVAEFVATADREDGQDLLRVASERSPSMSPEHGCMPSDVLASCRSSTLASPHATATGIPIELDLFSVSSQMGDPEHESADSLESHSHRKSRRSSRSSVSNLDTGRTKEQQSTPGHGIDPCLHHGDHLDDSGSERDAINFDALDHPEMEELEDISSTDHRSTRSGNSRFSAGTFVLLDDIIDVADTAPLAPAVGHPETPAADQSAVVDSASSASAASTDGADHIRPAGIDIEDPRTELAEVGQAALTRSPIATSISSSSERSEQSPAVVRSARPTAIRQPTTDLLHAQGEADGLIWPDTATEVIQSLASRFPWPSALPAGERENEREHLDIDQYSPGLSLGSDETTGPTSLESRPHSVSSSRSSASDSDADGHPTAAARDVDLTLSPSCVAFPPRFRSSHPGQLHSRATSRSAWSDIVDVDTDTRSLFAVADGYHVHLALSEETRKTIEIELRTKAKSVPDLLLVGHLDPGPLSIPLPPPPPVPREAPPTSLPTSLHTPRTPSPTSLRNRVRARARERHLSMAGSPSPPVSPYASEPLPALPIPPRRNLQGLQEEEGDVVLIERRQAFDTPDTRLGSPWAPSAPTAASPYMSSAQQQDHPPPSGTYWSPASTATPPGSGEEATSATGVLSSASFPPVPALSRSVRTSEYSTPGGSRSSASSHLMSPGSVDSASSFGDMIAPSHAHQSHGGRFTSPRNGNGSIDTIQEERASPESKTLADLDLKGGHAYNVAWGAQRDYANDISPVMMAKTDRSFPPSSFALSSKSRQQDSAEDGSRSRGDHRESASDDGHYEARQGQPRWYDSQLRLQTTSGQRGGQPAVMPSLAGQRRAEQSLLEEGLAQHPAGRHGSHKQTIDAAKDAPPHNSARDSGTAYAHRSRRENQSYSSAYSASSHPFSASSSRSGGGGFGRRPSTSESVELPHPFAAHSYDSGTSALTHKQPGTIRTAPAHQVALADEEDLAVTSDEVCPICVESLSSTYRLPGEKSHVTPLCGHSLHHECFRTVYGPVPESAILLKRTNFGICGVCRKPMQLLDNDEFGEGVGKAKQSIKLAAMTGMTSPTGSAGTAGNPNVPRPGVPTSSSATSLGSAGQSSDTTGDDPLDATGPVTPAPKPIGNAGPVIIPSIAIKPEHPSLLRRGPHGSKQVLTCLITVEAPCAGPRLQYASPTSVSAPSGPPPPRAKPTVDRVALPTTSSSMPDPFAHVAADLQHRLIDYKSSGLDSLGPIKLYDILRVRKGSFVLQICVYLFEQALICVSEEKKKGLRGLLSSQSSQSLRGADGRDRGKRDKTPLKLTGRIYLHHVKRIVDSTVQGELSLTIAMRDEALDSFILTYNDRSSLEMWKSTLQRLLGQDEQSGSGGDHSGGPKTGNSTSSLGGKLAKMGFDDATLACVAGFAQSPTSASGSRHFAEFSPADFSPTDRGQREQMETPATGRTSSSFASATSASSSLGAPLSRSRFGLAPLAPQHTPLDLLIVTSLPPRSGASSAASPMKQRIILATLEFVMALLGPRDRLSIVAFEPWQGGSIRRTPLLCPAKIEGRRKLETFLEVIGGGAAADNSQDSYLVEGSGEERVDVVASVNAGLDVLMQRRAKNSLTGMVLVSDTAESIKRLQMDLLLARAEAANVPIHSVGYGKNQDPSALWLMSSHTHGTYTFVKEWYDLRDCLAGIIGGMLSIALTGMKIHLSARETEFRCRKVSGAIAHVISSDGKDIDVELKELQYGQRVEFLVEMEFESGHQRASGDSSGQYAAGSSDEGNDSASQRYSSGRSLRKDSSYTGESFSAHAETNGQSDNLLLMSDDRLVDEVPVFDLDCSYRDPAAARSVARLSHPILLTVALLPVAAQTQMSPDLGVVRRRYELLASESITRCLLLVARSNWQQAQRLMQETTRILSTIIGQLSAEPHRPHHSAMRARREEQSKATVQSLQAVLGDIDTLLEGMEEQRDMFERDHRNFGAQQAMVLRNQKSWSQRTPTERLYCLEGSLEVVRLSQGWQAA